MFDEPRIQRSGFMLLKDEACFNPQLFRYRQELVKESVVGELACVHLFFLDHAVGSDSEVSRRFGSDRVHCLFRTV